MGTGIFARIAAGAAEEDILDGKEDVTPYWRTLKAGGAINDKYPGGVDAQKELLEEEGHTILKKGKRFVIADYEKHLVDL